MNGFLTLFVYITVHYYIVLYKLSPLKDTEDSLKAFKTCFISFYHVFKCSGAGKTSGAGAGGNLRNRGSGFCSKGLEKSIKDWQTDIGWI